MKQILLFVGITYEVASVASGVQYSLPFCSPGRVRKALGKALVSQSEEKTVEHRVRHN